MPHFEKKISLCIHYKRQNWQRRREPILARGKSPGASERISFNLCLPLSQISNSVSLCANGDGMLLYLLKRIHIRPVNPEFKNSIRTSSDSLLTCHKSDYLHPRWGRHEDVKVISSSQQLSAEAREKQELKLLANAWEKWVRGKVQFIFKAVLTWVVKFSYSVGSGGTELSTPSRPFQWVQFTDWGREKNTVY